MYPVPLQKEQVWERWISPEQSLISRHTFSEATSEKQLPHMYPSPEQWWQEFLLVMVGLFGIRERSPGKKSKYSYIVVLFSIPMYSCLLSTKLPMQRAIER